MREGGRWRRREIRHEGERKMGGRVEMKHKGGRRYRMREGGDEGRRGRPSDDVI